MALPATDLAQAPLLDISGVTLQYRTDDHLVTATWNVSFQAWAGERLVLLGPSGCGKSTLLKAIGGYLKPSAGGITINGSPITAPGPDRVMVFQEFDQLLPWKTVKENVVFALTTGGKLSKREAEERALYFIDKVHLTKFADTYPHMLSGGMKQRVAIARCLAMKAEVVLMDEPFASLDALTRQRMQEELLELWDDVRFTMIFVTHSIEEAILLGSRIILLSPHPGQVRAELNVDPAALGDGENGEFRDLRDRIHRILFKDTLDYCI